MSVQVVKIKESCDLCIGYGGPQKWIPNHRRELQSSNGA